MDLYMLFTSNLKGVQSFLKLIYISVMYVVLKQYVYKTQYKSSAITLHSLCIVSFETSIHFVCWYICDICCCKTVYTIVVLTLYVHFKRGIVTLILVTYTHLVCCLYNSSASTSHSPCIVILCAGISVMYIILKQYKQQQCQNLKSTLQGVQYSHFCNLYTFSVLFYL